MRSENKGTDRVCRVAVRIVAFVVASSFEHEPVASVSYQFDMTKAKDTQTHSLDSNHLFSSKIAKSESESVSPSLSKRVRDDHK